jgi:hypothetical protein
MRARLSSVLVLSSFLAGGVAYAKKKPAAKAPVATADQRRSMADLAGKFKWGMSEDEVFKVIEDATHARYKELVAKEPDVNKQDDLRKKELEDIARTKSSLVMFEGKKTGWDVSIIDKEFAQRNDEAMITMWEKDQRRFLFFWHDKLYKQFIAFDSTHPVFKDKSFDDFVKLIEGRYGQSQMKFSQMKTKDDMVVDHIEWPAAGDFQLWAIDQASFYGNFCLRLFQPSTQAQLDKIHAEKNPHAGGNALIDAVTKPDEVSGDKNADVVDQIMGKKKSTSGNGSDL